MHFLDRARIYAKAGDGGNGVTAFRREKFVPRGGPSGGDGGRGGDVYMESSDQLNTLLHFRFNPRYVAGRGNHGEGSNRSGREGEDVVIQVPVGTVVTDLDSGELVHDFAEPGERILIAAGGRGGRGNAAFATSTNRAPRRHEEGRPGQERNLGLELKLIADVGLVGLPNAGKSTLISRVSAAKPKIADYPFTTLEPNLGVVSYDEFKTYVVADIPGLIEGAHEGAGLGLDFLRHVERTRVLLHLVDVSGALESDPIDRFRLINEELGSYREDLLGRPMLVVATKIDALDGPDRLERLRAHAAETGREFFAISAVTGEGVDALKRRIGMLLEELGARSRVLGSGNDSGGHDEGR
jgi:GTP-binding protein